MTISPPSLPYRDKSRRRPLEEYLKIQGRFVHLRPEDIKVMEEKIDRQWELILRLAEIFK